MSRRFGRNQKRRMRAELAQVADEAAQQRARADNIASAELRNRQVALRLNYQVAELEDEINEAKAILGVDNLAFRAMVSEGASVRGREAPERVAMHVPQPILTDADLSHEAIGPMFENVELPTMTVEMSMDQMRRQMHTLLHYDGRARWAYAVNLEDLRRMPKDLAERRLAQVFAVMIGAELARLNKR